MRRFRKGSKYFELWASRDALVLKAITLVLTEELRPVLSDSCTHLAGNGGSKAAVRAVEAQLPNYEFAIRTDVKKYYASIDHEILTGILQETVKEVAVRRLLQQFLRRTIDDGGDYETVTKEIPLGSPLSPLLGALYLKDLDEKMGSLDVYYVRYMDDWVILAPSRWKLRNAIRLMNDTLEELKLDLHPNKTFIGKISKGFDFLGYHLTRTGLGVAEKTIRNYAERATQLQEQGATKNRLGEYVRHWLIWVKSGVTLPENVLSAMKNVMEDWNGLKKLLNQHGEKIWGENIIGKLKNYSVPNSAMPVGLG